MAKQARVAGVTVTTPTSQEAEELGLQGIKSIGDIVERMKNDDGVGEKNTNAACVIPLCTGTIIEKRSKKYFGDPARAIIGSGYRGQMTLIVELFCSRCGIQYHHLPKKPNE